VTISEMRLEAPPRTNVFRTAPFAHRAAAPADERAGDGLTLDGFAAVFHRKALIDSWEGRFWEDIASGSMRKSFREAPPKIQFDHGRHPLIGSIPSRKPPTRSSHPTAARMSSATSWTTG
jgi:hypothetical protein